MTRHFKKSLSGVTLLEIMLVLAIAAMIIVMSVKYYQNATSSQSTNSALQAIQSITAAADGISQATGTYTSVSTSTIPKVAGSNALILPWNQTITITGAGSSYKVTLPQTPGVVCNSLTFKLKANSHYSGFSACATPPAASDFSYTYSS